MAADLRCLVAAVAGCGRRLVTGEPWHTVPRWSALSRRRIGGESTGGGSAGGGRGAWAAWLARVRHFGGSEHWASGVGRRASESLESVMS